MREIEGKALGRWQVEEKKLFLLRRESKRQLRLRDVPGPQFLFLLSIWDSQCASVANFSLCFVALIYGRKPQESLMSILPEIESDLKWEEVLEGIPFFLDRRRVIRSCSSSGPGHLL